MVRRAAHTQGTFSFNLSSGIFIAQLLNKQFKDTCRQERLLQVLLLASLFFVFLVRADVSQPSPQRSPRMFHRLHELIQ
eukprot:756346-Hanusia_phi.AAC.7